MSGGRRMGAVERIPRAYDVTDEELARAAIDSLAGPDLHDALPEPEGHQGEHQSAIEQATPHDPEASSATARTSGGDWSDATTEPGARTGAPRSTPTDPELDALDALAGGSPELPAARPERAVRPDDSMEADDDSPDAQHAMAGRPPDVTVRPEGQPPAPLARDDAEPMGDATPDGFMMAPSGEVEDFGGRVDRLARGGDFATTLPDAEDQAEQYGDDDALAALAGDDDPEPLPGKPPVDAAREAAAGPLPRLDDGLPTEERIAGARGSDVGNEVLRRIGNMFAGAIGRAPRARHDEAPDLEQQRAQGMQQRLASKGTQRHQEATDARASADAATEAQQAADASRRADESLALRREGLDLQRQSVASLDESRDATRSRLDAAEQRRETEAGASADPESPASQAERLAFSVARMRLRGEAGRALDEALAAEGIDPQHASAAQLRRANDIMRTIGVRGTGAGGTGTPSGGPGLADRLAAQYVEHGIARDEESARAAIDALGLTGARARLASRIDEETRAPGARGAPVGEGGRGVPILPGVYTDPELAITPVEARTIRTDLTHASQQLGALEQLQSIGAEYGRTGVVSPAAEARAVAARSTMMAMVAQLEGSGIIGPGDLPRIQAAIPNPTDSAQAVLQTMPDRIRGFTAAIDQGARRQLRLRGVSEDSIDAALRMLHGAPASRGSSAPSTGAPTSPSAPSAAPAPPRPGMTLMTLPSGAQRWIPDGNVEAARERGAEVVDGP